MSKICQITGKKAMIGNNVSHSKRRTKRTFDLNLFNKEILLCRTGLLDQPEHLCQRSAHYQQKRSGRCSEGCSS